MASSRIWCLGSTLVLILVFRSSCGQDMEDNSVNDGESAGVTALERGMQPFYGMTRTFLDLVIKEDLRNTDPTLFNLTLSSVCPSEDSSGEDLRKYVMENWQSLLGGHAAFIACVAVGILFIILLPIVGLCFCCCRLCGHCGGKVNPREGRHHKCRQYTCGTILFLCNTIMLIGLVFAFMTNEQLRILTSTEDNVVDRTQGRIQSLSNFVGRTIPELDQAYETLKENLNNIESEINSTGENAAEYMDQETGAASLLMQARQLVDGLSMIEILLGYVDGNKTVIVSNLSDLETTINQWKNNALTSLNQCSTAVCVTLKDDINSIGINVDYEQMSMDIQNQISQLGGLGDVKMLISDGLDSYNGAFDGIDTEVAKHIPDARAEKMKILDVVRQELNKPRSYVTQVTNILGNSSMQLNSYEPIIETYGTYIWYAGITLCCVLLLIVLCYFLGLIFGVCGDPPYDDVNACNKGVGANLLLAGVGFCFLFGWLLMLVCTSLYIVGQVVHSEVCSPITKNETQSGFLESSNKPLILSEWAVLATFDDHIAGCFSASSLNITISSTIIKRCEQNKALYQAFDLDKSFTTPDISSFDVKEQLDKLRIATNAVAFGNVEITNDSIRNELAKIENASVDDLPLTTITNELDKQTLTEDIDGIKTELERQRQVFTDGGDATSAQNVGDLLLELESVKAKLDAVQGNMPELLDNLRKAVDDLENLLNAETAGSTIRQKAKKLNDDLDIAQMKINNEGKDILETFLNKSADDLYQNFISIFTQFFTTIKEDVGRCRPVYDHLQGALNIICMDSLNPYNGIWFSFGWTLAFFIPAIISAVHLAGSYRKTEDYDPNDNKSFDEPNFDAYSGGIYPGDNIPLEDYHGRKAAARGGGGGLPNSAYVADRSPPAMPPRDYSPRDNYYRNGGPPAYPGHSGEGYGGRGAGYRGGPTPPNPPHYYNNRPGRY